MSANSGKRTEINDAHLVELLKLTRNIAELKLAKYRAANETEMYNLNNAIDDLEAAKVKAHSKFRNRSWMGVKDYMAQFHPGKSEYDLVEGKL
jgi:hypothetical protein